MQPNQTTERKHRAAHTVSELSNAQFSGLRTTGKATVLLGSDSKEYILAGVTRENLANITENFDRFIAKFKDANDGIAPRKSRKEAEEIFVQRVVPALKLAGVKILDTRKADDATVAVIGMDSGDADVTMKIPLRQGFNKFFRSDYDAHAMIEETLHFLQDVNGRPLH